MATTPLSSIVARANKARIQVSSLGRSAFSDLGGIPVQVPIQVQAQHELLIVVDDLISGLLILIPRTIRSATQLAVKPPDLTDGSTNKGLRLFVSLLTHQFFAVVRLEVEAHFASAKNVILLSHKKTGNIVPCSGMLCVRKMQDSAFIDPPWHGHGPFGSRFPNNVEN
jgi:hypothetical protein